MAKKIKTPNQFGATDGTATSNETKAPVDETHVPAVHLKKDGTPWKQRVPSGPRTVNPKIAEYRADMKRAMADFVADQKAGYQALIKSLRVESDAAKMAARLEKKLLDMTPAEKAWMAKATAEQLAKVGAPELAQQP